MSLTRDFDLLFNAMTDSAFGNRWVAAEEAQGSTFYPATDVVENEKGYLVSFDLPGIPEKDVKIGVKDRILTIAGERNRQMQKEGKSWSRTERGFGRFTRSFTLPEHVDVPKIEAQFENGVLHLFLPKAPEEKPLEIPIGTTNKLGAATGTQGEVVGLIDRFFAHEKAATKPEDKH